MEPKSRVAALLGWRVWQELTIVSLRIIKPSTTFDMNAGPEQSGRVDTPIDFIRACSHSAMVTAFRADQNSRTIIPGCGYIDCIFEKML